MFYISLAKALDDNDMNKKKWRVLIFGSLLYYLFYKKNFININIFQAIFWIDIIISSLQLGSKFIGVFMASLFFIRFNYN
jgi:hypothetical protein